jgi:hypothetical protein
MIYFDERGVSRRYLVDLRNDQWHWWCDSPGFSQRFTGTLVDGGKRIVGVSYAATARAGKTTCSSPPRESGPETAHLNDAA